MNIFLEEEDLKEIKPLEPSEDKGVVINSEVGKREEGKSDLVKEMAAIDALMVGPVEASKIHGVPQSSASKYSSGKDIANSDARARVLSAKYDIEDIAVTKLMETLSIINPQDVEKVKDKVMLMNGLSNLVGKITPSKDEGDVKTVHLHLYAPNQKKESDYKVIDV